MGRLRHYAAPSLNAYSLFAVRCSLLAARCSLLAARCSLLAARFMIDIKGKEKACSWLRGAKNYFARSARTFFMNLEA